MQIPSGGDLQEKQKKSFLSHRDNATAILAETQAISTIKPDDVETTSKRN